MFLAGGGSSRSSAKSSSGTATPIVDRIDTTQSGLYTLIGSQAGPAQVGAGSLTSVTKRLTGDMRHDFGMIGCRARGG